MAATTRKIVKIDEDRCNGCGLCVPSCAEGAIKIIDGKARLLAENLCDGLGNCLGECPRDAITIEERPAEAFDEAAVETHLHKELKSAMACPSVKAPAAGGHGGHGGGCPGSRVRKLDGASAARGSAAAPVGGASRLSQWPVQLMLLPTAGDLWDGADVLLSADCVAHAMGDFHDRLLAGKTLAIACPKLDDVEPYIEKLAKVFADNDVASVTVARMEVPCCGLDFIAEAAMERAGKAIPINVVVVGVGGAIRSVNGVAVG